MPSLTLRVSVVSDRGQYKRARGKNHEEGKAPTMSNEKIDPQENEHLVITPGGPRPKNRVHVVPPGSAVLFGDDGKSAGAPVPETAHHLQPRTTSMADDLVLTPGGYRPRSTVHLVQPGHSVHHKGRLPHTAALVPRAANEAARASIPPGPPTTSNWISYAGWLNTTGNTITVVPDDLGRAPRPYHSGVAIALSLQWHRAGGRLGHPSARASMGRLRSR